MKIIRYNRQEFEACLEKGHDWKSRCEIVGSAVEEILEDSPNKIHRAGDLTSAILKAYDVLGDRSNPMYRLVSKSITAIGKLPENKKFISLGKEIRCGNKPDGSPRWARERLWRLAPDLAPAEVPEEHWPTSYQLKHKGDKSWGEVGASMADTLLEVRLKAQSLDEAQAALEAKGYTVVPPARLSKHCHVKIEYSDNSKPSWELDTVQGVDNPNISKHPSPGAARVDCGVCGGSGKVYIKQGA